MARYATDEEQYQCDRCEARPTLREMTVKVLETDNKDTNYHCPQCDVQLIATNEHGLFMRVFRMTGIDLSYVRTDGINEPFEGI